ncbi:unnamed protein product [Caenorhabditis angaria]|uniref:Uncharacterized protein n=1 Tax=Caenorhabditis angaria TaxID=860376 RepID=A0A9P1MVB9_9PELO|nr:unnamed protein product [Caenorhabditis angaria]
MSQKFLKHEVDHLEHIPIGYIKDRHYAIVTRDGSKFFSNYTCYHKSCDIVIQAMSEKDREVLLLVQKAYSVNGPRELSKFFYLNEKEFDAFCQESLKYIENADSDEWREACKEMQLTQDENHQVAWNMTRDHNSLRETFPRDRVSDEDIEKIKKNFKSRTMKDKNGMNVTSLKKYLALSSLFEANYKRAKLYLDNLEMFQEGKRGRQFIMRMINDKRINDFDEWFLCRGEIYEFVDIIMQQIEANEKQSDLLFDWISEYEDNDKMFVPVKEFEKYLNILKIDKNRVIFVPDVDFMKDWIDIPLQINPLGSTVYMTEGIKGLSEDSGATENVRKFCM